MIDLVSDMSCINGFFEQGSVLVNISDLVFDSMPGKTFEKVFVKEE